MSKYRPSLGEPKYCTYCEGFEIPGVRHMCDAKWEALMAEANLQIALREGGGLEVRLADETLDGEEPGWKDEDPT